MQGIIYSMLKQQSIIIVGTGHQAANLFRDLLNTGNYRILKVIDPSVEDIGTLSDIPDLDIIINTSDSPAVDSTLQRLKLDKTSLISGHCADLLFCTGTEELKKGDYTTYREKVLESLSGIKQTLFFTIRKEELLKTLLDLTRRTLDADSGSIMLLDKRKRCLTIEMADGLESAIVKTTVQKLGTGVAGMVAKSGKPQIISESDPERGRSDIISSMSSPLVIGDQVVGVININSKRSERTFNNSDLQHLSQLAQFTADIVKTSKDYETTSAYSFYRSFEDGIEDILTMEQYPFLERISLLLLKLSNTFSGEICNFYHFNSENSDFILQASSAINRNLTKYKAIKLNPQFAGQILENGNGFCISRLEESRTKWYLAEPIRFEGELIGLLFLHKINEGAGVEKEMQILKSTAALISQAIREASQEERVRAETLKYSALSEVAFELAGAQGVNQLAKLIVSNACLILGAEISVFCLYNRFSKQFSISDIFSLGSIPDTEAVRLVNNTVLRRAKANRKGTLLVADFAEFFPELQDGVFYPRSAMCKYLIVNGQTIGALSLFNKNDADLFHRRAFDNSDSDFLSQFCRHIVKALSLNLAITENQPLESTRKVLNF